MSKQNTPHIVEAISKFCSENGISTDEQFFSLFNSINWHDADVDNVKQFIQELSFAKLRQNNKDTKQG